MIGVCPISPVAPPDEQPDLPGSHWVSRAAPPVRSAVALWDAAKAT